MLTGFDSDPPRALFKQLTTGTSAIICLHDMTNSNKNLHVIKQSRWEEIFYRVDHVLVLAKKLWHECWRAICL